MEDDFDEPNGFQLQSPLMRQKSLMPSKKCIQSASISILSYEKTDRLGVLFNLHEFLNQIILKTVDKRKDSIMGQSYDCQEKQDQSKIAKAIEEIQKEIISQQRPYQSVYHIIYNNQFVFNT